MLIQCKWVFIVNFKFGSLFIIKNNDFITLRRDNAFLLKNLDDLIASTNEQPCQITHENQQLKQRNDQLALWPEHDVINFVYIVYNVILANSRLNVYIMCISCQAYCKAEETAVSQNYL